MSTYKKASDLKFGDVTQWYKVLLVTVTKTKSGSRVIAVVKHNDGVIDERVWKNPNTLVPVK